MRPIFAPKIREILFSQSPQTFASLSPGNDDEYRPILGSPEKDSESGNCFFSFRSRSPRIRSYFGLLLGTSVENTGNFISVEAT
jgi:hypothetical protein